MSYREIRLITDGPTADEIHKAMSVLKCTKKFPELLFKVDVYINRLWCKSLIELSVRSIEDLPEGKVKLTGHSSEGFPFIPDEDIELYAGEYKYHSTSNPPGYIEVEIVYRPKNTEDKETEGKVLKYEFIPGLPCKK